MNNRKKLQFSLAAVIALVTIAALVAAVWRWAHAEERAIERLRAGGAACRYIEEERGWRIVFPWEFKSIDTEPLADIRSIYAIHAQTATLSEDDFVNFSHARGLRVLNLHRATLDPNALEHLQEIETLEELYLEDMDLTDEDVKPIAKLTLLKQLRLNGNSRLTDECLTYLTGLETLESLDLDDTSISGKSAALLQMKLPNADIMWNGKYGLPVKSQGQIPVP